MTSGRTLLSVFRWNIVCRRFVLMCWRNTRNAILPATGYFIVANVFSIRRDGSHRINLRWVDQRCVQCSADRNRDALWRIDAVLTCPSPQTTQRSVECPVVRGLHRDRDATACDDPVVSHCSSKKQRRCTDRSQMMDLFSSVLSVICQIVFCAYMVTAAMSC